jgi:beta-1,4-mannosyl-glycoprotein beta-1,4-N-acetylglucosaminyltransferase
MIVDCFPFYNELAMLKYRLETLSPVVDKFVLVESPLTHRGNPKKLYYQENKHLFEKYSDKIIHLIDENLVQNPSTPWLNEAHQRDYIGKGLLGLVSMLRLDDVILISDVDEIFDPEVIKNIETHLGQNPYVSLNMDIYYYNIETKLDINWTHPKAARFSYIMQGIPTRLRNGPPGTIVPNAGWHLSYFGDPKMIINKLKNFAHDELSELYSTSDEERVANVVKNGQDIAGRPDVPLVHVLTENNPRLPPNYQTILITLEEYDKHI